jgi:hypothetical protein
MTFYTSDPLPNNQLPLQETAPLGQSLAAEFREGLNQGPVASWGEESRLAQLNSDPSGGWLSQQEGQQIFKDNQVESIDVPPGGISRLYANGVIQDRQNELNRLQILQSAPSGALSSPLKYMANLGGNMADPGNTLIGFVPFFGEARAATVLGRAAQRFVQGAGYGALQTAATMPFVAEGQAAEGNEMTMGDIATNMLMGTVGGGLLHAGGGIIADALRVRDPALVRVNDDGGEVLGKPVEGDPQPDTGLPVESPAAEPGQINPSIAPELTPADELASSLDKFRDDYAYQTAYNDVTPDYVDNLERTAANQITGVNELRTQIASTQQSYDALDATLSNRTKEYQSQQMKFKEARAAALRDIETEKQQLLASMDAWRQQIETNRVATQAAQELARIRQGNISDSLRQSIDQRAQEIRGALNQSPIAQGVKSAMQRYNEADWYVRNQAMRGVAAQMRRGEDVNIEPFFDLVDPDKKMTALESLSAPRRIPSPPEDIAASQAADGQLKASGEVNGIDDALRQAEENVNYARQVNEAIATDDPEFFKLVKQVNEEAGDTSMEKAIKAAALCRIGKMNG